MHTTNALANSSRHPFEERMGKLKVPTLIIMGTKDSDFPDPIGEPKIISEQTGGR